MPTQKTQGFVHTVVAISIQTAQVGDQQNPRSKQESITSTPLELLRGPLT